MKKLTFLCTLLVVAAVALSACSTPSPASTTPTIPVEDLVATSAAQTVEALTTQLAQQATATPEPTATSEPTATQTVAAQPTNTVPVILLPTNTSAVVPTSAVCDKAQFVADVTVPDDTSYSPGASFTKTWRLKNVGTCTWSTSYKLVFKSGNAMEGPASVNMPASVAPGATVDISINLKAPASGGTFTGNYKLQNASGTDFGVGVSGQESFWVKIVVTGGPTATSGPSPTAGPSPTGGPSPTAASYFAVTAINLSLNQTNYSGTCPVTVTASAAITVNKAGEISYSFLLNDVAQPEAKLNFDAPGTKTVTFSFDVGATGTYAVKIYNNVPNHQTWGPVVLTVTCTAP